MARWSRDRWAASIVLLVVWFVLLPVLFVILYATIEIQDASRQAVGTDSKLANFTIVRLSENLQKLNDQQAGISLVQGQQVAALNMEKDRVDRSRSQLRNDVLAFSTKYGLGFDPQKCTAEWPAVSYCYDDIAIQAAARLPSLAPEVRPGFQAGLESLAKTAGATREMVMNYNGTVRGLKVISDHKAELAKEYKALTVATEGGTVTPTGAVAYTYRKMDENIPGFRVLYMLPTGVIIAVFTAIMGAVGAAITSLFSEIDVARRGLRPVRSLMAAYGMHPLLGALAGFTVFFVVSAGAAFLVQPGATGSTSAVNNLSPPALASLGVFAGLAAEQAVRWLREKASSFFKTDEAAAEAPAPDEDGEGRKA